MNLKLLFETRVSKFIYLGVIFDYLSDEVFKTFAPTCKLTGPTNSTNIATACEVVGHRVEMFLLENLEIGLVYNLEITDMPNPDFGFCEPIPLRVIVSNALKSKTLLVSSPFINNINKEPFTNQENTKILDFVSIPDGYLDVWRGFYSVVYAGPTSQDPTERLFYTDKVKYTLSFDLDGLVASTPINYYGISDFQSEIGESRSPFIIGASTNTVTTNYVLYILRAETFR